MKLLSNIFSIIILLLICSGCGNKDSHLSQAPAKVYPYIDTVKFGVKSDSGEYALFEVYYKHFGKDTALIDGASEVKVGNKKWRIITTTFPADWMTNK